MKNKARLQIAWLGDRIKIIREMAKTRSTMQLLRDLNGLGPDSPLKIDVLRWFILVRKVDTRRHQHDPRTGERRGRWTPEMVQEAYAMLQTESLHKVGLKYGVTRERMRQVMRKAGLKPVRRVGAPRIPRVNHTCVSCGRKKTWSWHRAPVVKEGGYLCGYCDKRKPIGVTFLEGMEMRRAGRVWRLCADHAGFSPKSGSRAAQTLAIAKYIVRVRRYCDRQGLDFSVYQGFGNS